MKVVFSLYPQCKVFTFQFWWFHIPAGADPWTEHLCPGMGRAHPPQLLINEMQEFHCENSSHPAWKWAQLWSTLALAAGGGWAQIRDQLTPQGGFPPAGLTFSPCLEPVLQFSVVKPIISIISWPCYQCGKQNTFPSRASLMMPPQSSAALLGPEQNSELLSPSDIKPDWNQTVLSVTAQGWCFPVGLSWVLSTWASHGMHRRFLRSHLCSGVCSCENWENQWFGVLAPFTTIRGFSELLFLQGIPDSEP